MIIAFKHYLRTTDDDFQRAAELNLAVQKGESDLAKKSDLSPQKEAKGEALIVDQILLERVKNDVKGEVKVETAHVLSGKTQKPKYPEQDSNKAENAEENGILKSGEAKSEADSHDSKSDLNFVIENWHQLSADAQSQVVELILATMSPI